MTKAKCYSEGLNNFFRVADYESDLRLLKSIYSYMDGDLKFEKISDYAERLYTKVFCVADYEFDLRFSYFQIADPF